MLKKFFVCAIFTAMIFLTGCGADKVVGSADKAVLAYAEITMTGESPNMSAAGFSEDDGKEIRYRVAKTFVDSMENIAPLSDATATEVTNVYFDKLKGASKFNVTLKKNDADRPIVALTATPIDQTATVKASAGKNDEILALIGMVGQLKSDGATDEQLKNNPDVQKLAVAALTKYIENICFRPEETLDVLCKKMTGRDGNIHWAPADEEAFVNFLTGQN